MGTNIMLAFQGIWGHKLRSFLTMLGIIIGIASLITIVSTINGTNQKIKESVVGAGNNAVTITLNDGNIDLDMSSGIPQGIKVATDAQRAHLETLTGVKSASLYRYRQYNYVTFYKNNQYTNALYGIDNHYFDTVGMKITEGRDFLAGEYTDHSKVVIVDSRTASNLFNGDDVVGSIIEIAGEPFTVVGICESKTNKEPDINSVSDYETYAMSGSSGIYLPADAWDIVFQYDEPYNVVVKADRTDDMTKAGTAAAKYLNETLVSSSDYSYSAKDLLEQAQELQSLTSSTNSQLIWIAGISLLVGGIGVMNIMLVSVTERTREIGIKKAIGAKERVIRMQFLTEAAVLTLMGGVIGVIVGIGLSFLINLVIGSPVSISVWACVVALVFSMVIGIIFGLAPAVKAAKLNPIEALRSE